MLEFLKALKEWLPLILPALELIVSIIIILFVKKGKLSDVKSYILEKLPEIISSIEFGCETGVISKEKKKESAVALAISDCSIKFGSLSSSNITALTKFVDENIEKILSTPQKK